MAAWVALYCVERELEEQTNKWAMCIVPLGTILCSALSNEASSTAGERGRLASANLLQSTAPLHLFIRHCKRESIQLIFALI